MTINSENLYHKYFSEGTFLTVASARVIQMSRDSSGHQPCDILFFTTCIEAELNPICFFPLHFS